MHFIRNLCKSCTYWNWNIKNAHNNRIISFLLKIYIKQNHLLMIASQLWWLTVLHHGLRHCHLYSLGVPDSGNKKTKHKITWHHQVFTWNIHYKSFGNYFVSVALNYHIAFWSCIEFADICSFHNWKYMSKLAQMLPLEYKTKYIIIELSASYLKFGLKHLLMIASQ